MDFLYFCSKNNGLLWHTTSQTAGLIPPSTFKSVSLNDWISEINGGLRDGNHDLPVETETMKSKINFLIWLNAEVLIRHSKHLVFTVNIRREGENYGTKNSNYYLKWVIVFYFLTQLLIHLPTTHFVHISTNTKSTKVNNR